MRHVNPRKHVHSGHSLVELLISVVLLLIVMGSVMAVFFPLYEQNKYKLLENAMHLEANDLMTYISDDIKRAGYSDKPNEIVKIEGSSNTIDVGEHQLAYGYRRNNIYQYQCFYLNKNRLYLQVENNPTPLSITRHNLCKNGELFISSERFKVNRFYIKAEDIEHEKHFTQEINFNISIATLDESLQINKLFNVVLRNAAS